MYVSLSETETAMAIVERRIVSLKKRLKLKFN